MCNCKNITIGSYANQTIMKNWWDGGLIGIDNCLKIEIAVLWRLKIRTTGCCCGHNIEQPYINVTKRHVARMIKHGYDYFINDFNVICFIPKSL
jgi:hypothetical protein